MISQGNYAAWNYFQSIDRAENHLFVNAFRARFGPQRVTSDPMEAAYVGVHLWAQAVAEAGCDDVVRIREALRYQRLNAPEGAVHIDPANQHTWKTIRVGRIVEEGQFDIIYSSENPIRPEPYPDSRSIDEWQLVLNNSADQLDFILRGLIRRADSRAGCTAYRKRRVDSTVSCRNLLVRQSVKFPLGQRCH